MDKVNNRCARCKGELRKHTGENRRCPYAALGCVFVPMLLSPGTVKLLNAMAQESLGVYGPELVFEKGAGWWIGCYRTSGLLARQLIQLCLISLESDSRPGEYERWVINEEGREMLVNTMYRPKILEAFGKELQ